MIMSNEAIIIILLSIIGCLLGVCVGLFMKSINEKFSAIQKTLNNLDDMFVRHVRNSKIHVSHGQVVD